MAHTLRGCTLCLAVSTMIVPQLPDIGKSSSSVPLPISLFFFDVLCDLFQTFAFFRTRARECGSGEHGAISGKQV